MLRIGAASTPRKRVQHFKQDEGQNLRWGLLTFASLCFPQAAETGNGWGQSTNYPNGNKKPKPQGPTMCNCGCGKTLSASRIKRHNKAKAYSESFKSQSAQPSMFKYKTVPVKEFTKEQMDRFYEEVCKLQEDNIRKGNWLPFIKIVPPNDYPIDLVNVHHLTSGHKLKTAIGKSKNVKMDNIKVYEITKKMTRRDQLPGFLRHNLGSLKFNTSSRSYTKVADGLYVVEKNNDRKHCVADYVREACQKYGDSSEKLSDFEDTLWTNFEKFGGTQLYMEDLSAYPVFSNPGVDLMNFTGGLKADGEIIYGVNSPFTYIGVPYSGGEFHQEDGLLNSINVHHGGAPKVWYGVGPNRALDFERKITEAWPQHFQYCPAFMKHRHLSISPKWLNDNKIPFYKLQQNPGEIVVTFMAGYHQVRNMGVNIAAAVNFSTPQWEEYGQDFNPCACLEVMRPYITPSHLTDNVRKRLELERRQLALGYFGQLTTKQKMEFFVVDTLGEQQKKAERSARKTAKQKRYRKRLAEKRRTAV